MRPDAVHDPEVDGGRARRAIGPVTGRGYRRLVAARTLVFFGNAVGVVGLSFGVLALPHGSGAELGLVLAVRGVGQVVLLLVGGVLGDRYRRARLMALADVLAGTSQLAIALLVVTDHNDVPLLAVMAGLNGAATGLFMPASTAILPELVPAPRLQSANAALRMSINIAGITGAAVAVVLIAATSPGACLIVTAATFFASALCLGGIRSAPPVREGTPASFWGEAAAGWATFAGHRWIWVIVVEAALINVVFRGATQVFGPVLARERPHGLSLWAVALGAQTVGLLIGSGIALRLRTRHPLRVAAICLALLGPAVILLRSGVPILVIAAAMLLAGVAVDLFTVLWETALQRNVPADQLSRVSSYDALGSFALAPLGLAVAGPLADSSMRDGITLGCGAAVVLSGLATLLVPEVWQLTDREPDPDYVSDT